MRLNQRQNGMRLPASIRTSESYFFLHILDNPIRMDSMRRKKYFALLVAIYITGIFAADTYDEDKEYCNFTEEEEEIIQSRISDFIDQKNAEHDGSCASVRGWSAIQPFLWLRDFLPSLSRPC